MERIKPHTLSGFMELLPARQAVMDAVTDTIRQVYSLYGFTPLDTPVIEAADVLLAKGGGETEKQIYRFTKGDSDLALRFDLTVPLAKYVAMNYADLSCPFRRYQIGKVYRGERAQRGRFREFYQADIDVIGDGELDIINEAEIPSVIYQVFTRLGLTRFVIRVNNRKLLTGFYDLLGLSDKSAAIMRAVDKLEKIGAERVEAILTDDLGISKEDAGRILDFMSIKGSNREVLAALEAYRGKDPVLDRGLDELRTVAEYLGAFGVPEANFALDLTIARGLDYYTGTVYETVMTDHPEVVHLLRRAVRRPGGLLHRQEAPRRGHLHRPYPAFLHFRRCGPSLGGRALRPLRRADPAPDRGPLRGRRPRHRPARGGHPGAALRGVEKIQGENGLCQPPGCPLRRHHRRG